jgi:S-DNA-T family DNA segregation ATPase FtsK/SpoIIIE
VPLWRVVGRPLTGRTSAARAVVLGAVDQHPPERLHVHVIDSADGLSDLSALPHVGTWCRAREADASSELLTHLADDVTARRSAPPGSGPPSLVLLVVDGWDQLLDADDPRSPDPVSDRLLRVLRDGPGVGVRAVVTGGRSLLQPRWSGLGGVMLLLGRTDPLDAVAAGLRERDLPRDPPPGRGVLAGDAREVQVVHTTTADLQQAGARWPAPPAARRPWRLRPLPRTVTRRDVEAPPPGDGLLVGVAGPLALPLVWDPGSTGGRLLVTGPPRSGRTTTLLALAESARVARRAVVLVGRSRTASDPVAGLTTLGPDDVEALVERRRSDPRLVVLVDDADHLDDAPVHAVLGEVADLAERDGGAVVVATTTSTLATRYRGFDVDAVRQGCGLVLAPRPGDAEVLGIRPRTFPGGPPGRGWWVVPGRSVAAQVLLPDLAPPQSPRSRAPRSSG